MESRLQQSAPYYRYTLRLFQHFPNFDLPFVLRLRRKAVDALQLPLGGRALDVGCGPGGTFPYLVHAVGPTGEVVGVEISPAVAETARKRVAVNEWKNVDVVVGDARNVVLSGKFDALVMLGAPDSYASPDALANLVPYLKDRARVVAFGMKLTERSFGSLLNRVMNRVMRLSFASTPALNHAPWKLLEAYTDDLEVQEYLHGCFFVAVGSVTVPR